MSLSDLAALGSFVSGFAVLVSLIFLYFQLRQIAQQVRQAERNQQAAIRQGRTILSVDINARGLEPSVSEALNRGYRGEEDMSATSIRQFQQYWRATFYIWSDAFYQHAEGLFPETAFNEIMLNSANWFRNIGVRAQWRIQRRGFAPEFAAWMDKRIAETPIVDESVDTAVLWQSAMAAERSGAPY